jgi:hypothetical protein
MVPPDSTVTLTVSTGPCECQIPNVVELLQEDAASVITDAGLTVGTITTEYNDTVAEGNVISQSPPADTEVPCGSAVDLVVSLDCFEVTVPSLVGMTEQEAKDALQAAGLQFDVTYQVTGDPKGQVISQDPTADTQVCEGSVVSIVVTSNNPPEADAGDDVVEAPLDDVLLDGSGSTDMDGDELTYSWTIVEEPYDGAAELDDPNAVRPILTIYDYGTYEVQLVVNDGQIDSAPDSVIISTHEPPPEPPVADAGDNQSVDDVNVWVCLDGSESYDPNGDEISYSWQIMSVPPGSVAELDDPMSQTPCFWLDERGDYEVELVVYDGELYSEPDYVTVSVVNVPPVADAGDDRTATIEEEVCLDGSESHDPDGDDLTYRWAILTKPDGSLAELDLDDLVDPCFIADEVGDYVIQLIVNDGELDSDPKTVNIRVPAEPICGDLDNDEDVDDDDYNLFLGTYGKSSDDQAYIAEADYDQDGIVALPDFHTWYECYTAYLNGVQ